MVEYLGDKPSKGYPTMSEEVAKKLARLETQAPTKSRSELLKSLGNIKKDIQKGVRRAGQTTMTVVHTAETQAAAGGMAWARGRYGDEEGNLDIPYLGLPINGTAGAAMVGVAAASVLFDEDMADAAKHMGAIGNGLLADFVSDFAFRQGATMRAEASTSSQGYRRVAAMGRRPAKQAPRVLSRAVPRAVPRAQRPAARPVAARSARPVAPRPATARSYQGL